MNFFDHKDLGNHLQKLCPEVVKHPVYTICVWRRLHNEDLNDLYSSSNIGRVIKSRRIRWAGHVARMDEERGCIGSCWGKPEGNRPLGDLGVDGWLILGWISRRWDVGIWTPDDYNTIVRYTETF